MKAIRTLALATLSLLGTAALAQQNPPPPAGGDQPQGARRGGMSVDDQLKMMTDKLNLTADQQTKIKPFLEDARTQSQAVMKDDSLSRDDKRAKMRGIRENTNSKIKDVLTDPQKKQFDAMQQEMRDRTRQRQPGGEYPPPPK
jgi:Spy/CpxP family protein refolding chaperone